ncbi:MAG: dihydrodipicolinate synthase family protein, partial [Verrucomicrobiota bacterium]
MTHSYTGIIPPMITPLKDHDTLHLSGLERLIERMLEGGVSGIFALGTTGYSARDQSSSAGGSRRPDFLRESGASRSNPADSE